MARKGKKFAVKPYTLAQHRALLENEAFPETALMRRVVNYNLLAYAVGQRLGQCDGCGSMGCDVRTATMITGPNERPMVLCAECGPTGRAHALVNEWVWGAELCDADTVRAARMLG